ncbi:hypothetical protein [Paenibacillus sp. NEAU-GSW1]|uniref:hypothetical protein n=1 Tax=Paenibacillus sp. NEAU-GSW1 TaxID=2682486 RepID=UPI0012E0C9C3|nr:hypothetical protein [Paenibacillus sp. NEAU-GSW1]MUT66053.1 hypothetical protein [Paenibacillus sp. NEAU-GSW1]
MDELLKQIYREKSQLEEHIKHKELAEYGGNNADDLMHLFNGLIQYFSKGAGKDAA